MFDSDIQWLLDRIALNSTEDQYELEFIGTGDWANANLYVQPGGETRDLIATLIGVSDQLLLSSESFLFL